MGALVGVLPAFLIFANAGCAVAQPVSSPGGLERIDRFVVVFLENRSFDNLFGLFPGANGLGQARPETTVQTDPHGQPYAFLPQVIDTSDRKSPKPHPRFTAPLPNRPFPIDPIIPQHEMDPDLVHRWYQEQLQINGGRMDRFAAVSDAGGFVMGYHDGSKMRLWDWARRYTLADNFFHAAFGGSFLNHFWLVCACTPRFENAPPRIVAQLGPNGELLKDGSVTPDGYAVNTLLPTSQPHPPNAKTEELLPPQIFPTIGDRLDDKRISWAWYSGGWNAALAGQYHGEFQFHHQPFAYFRNYGDGTDGRRQHLKDETELFAAIDNGTLPAVSFYKPIGEDNEHPGYASIAAGDARLDALLRRLTASPLFRSMAIIVTYDENGGFWDHMPPPKVDKWGPGTRIPAIVISPFAKRGFVDHAVYDTTSILRLLETRYGLAPLTVRDARANNLLNAFAFPN